MLTEKDINNQIKDLIANGKLQAAEHVVNYTRDVDSLCILIGAILDTKEYDKAYDLAVRHNIVQEVATQCGMVKRIEAILDEKKYEKAYKISKNFSIVQEVATQCGMVKRIEAILDEKEYEKAYKISKNFSIVQEVATQCGMVKRIEKILKEGNFELAYDTAINFNVIEEESIINGLTTLIAGMSASSVLSVRATGKYKKHNTKFNAKYDERLLEEGIGEIIEFGTYQNETIRWRVIDKSGGKKLLISEQAIDCKPYHSEYKSITWEECDLRKWLNNEFINEAFGEEEQKRINVTKIRNKDNEEYKTKGGNDTEDKVFLLSIEEAYKYFEDDNDRICKATDYAEKNGATTSSDGSRWWWLRSPGCSSWHAACVNYFGGVYVYGRSVDLDDYAVRPAFWLNP